MINEFSAAKSVSLQEQVEIDCTTCAIYDADICRSCMAKAVRAGEYPLWESKKERTNDVK